MYLSEAMKHGHVNVNVVKVIVKGSAGVGKTCLTHLLLDKPPPQERQSTGCAERSIRVIRVGKEGGEWNEISTNEFQKIIAEAVPVLYKELDRSRRQRKRLADVDKVLPNQELEEEKKEVGNEVGTEKQVGVKASSSGEEGRKIEQENQQKGDVGQGKKEKHTFGSEASKAAIDQAKGKLIQLVHSGTASHRLMDMELIYLIDTGGQQSFWDLIPIFARETSATLFVHRLCETLDEHPLNNLFQGGEQVGPSQRATLTTAQAFKTMLQSLHQEEEAQREGGHSKIITIGTHRDLAGNCTETLEEKNEKFSAIVSDHFQSHVVYRNEGLKEIVFPLNTKTPEEEDKKEARKIRASIEKGATQHKIPIWWFILQLILEDLAHKIGRGVLSKDDCLQVSSLLGFSEGELNAALDFFDKLNIFLYKEKVLPGAVFTDPNVPLDKLSRLVEKQHHLKAAEADSSRAADLATTGDWQSFRDRGVLTLKFLEEFKSHYVAKVFTPSDFLLLLEKLLIISPLSPTKYFFPAVLSMTSESAVCQFLVSHRATGIGALAVEFPTGWAPPGVYCCSVCHLQSLSGWRVAHKSPITSSSSKDTPQLPRITRNTITFTKPGRPGSVTFMDNFAFFVVCVNVNTRKMERDELAELCQAVRREVFAAVEAGLENTHHRSSHPVPAFLCPHQSESCSTDLHTAHLSDNKKRWICSKNTDEFEYLTPDQALWLTGTGECQYMVVQWIKLKLFFVIRHVCSIGIDRVCQHYTHTFSLSSSTPVTANDSYQ